jgi:lipid-binding SYLF domain-containing protein
MKRDGLWLEHTRRGFVTAPGMVAVLLVAAFMIAPVHTEAADDALEARQLAEKAQLTIEGFAADTNLGVLRDLLPKARGVLIAPQVLRGAFILGASGGSGVFLVHDAQAKKWSQPAFYTLGSVSFGLQAGGDVSEVVLLVMSERGVSALLGNNVKLGVDASVAVGPVGAGVAGATAALSADIISFSRSQGLYGGISVDGAVVAVREGWNSAYYGKPVTPSDILVRHAVTNPHSAALIAAVSKVASVR